MPRIVVLQPLKVLTIIRHPTNIPNDRSEVNYENPQGIVVLDRVTAIRFDERVQTGRTMPCRLSCETVAGDEVEVVAKLSAGCDRGIAALA
ncbi:MAG: hypothetical protein ABL878_16810 [Burkholderiales bacterium]